MSDYFHGPVTAAAPPESQWCAESAPVRLIVGIALTLMLATILAAPLLAHALPPLSYGLYAAFGWVCHQRPQRTWVLDGRPLAVCVRCLGIYMGALAGAVAGLRFSRALLYSALAVLAAEWLAEATIWPGAPAGLRFSTGLLSGFFLVPALWAEPRRAILRIDRVGEEARS